MVKIRIPKPVAPRSGPKGGTTIESALRQIFPNGYYDYDGYLQKLENPSATPERCTDFSRPPCSAVDLFAIAGFLLLKSGGYQRICPFVRGADTKGMVVVTKERRKKWVAAGKAWRGDGQRRLPPPPADLLSAWNGVVECLPYQLFLNRVPEAPPRRWWIHAAALLAIADEAAADLGFETPGAKSAQATMSEAPMRQNSRKGPYTLSEANYDQVCVLPKSRTPKVGCTVRSLSHHLALLPPRGMARVYWRPYASGLGELPSETQPFNVIIVPLPFQIQAQAFKGKPSAEASWGWFHVDPHWCPGSDQAEEIENGFEVFWSFLNDILEQGQRDVGTVHGLIFPEAALSHKVFLKVCERLKNRDGFELLVSGLFDVDEPGHPLRPGNFAAMARRQPPTEDGESKFDVSIREKHHRWRVEKFQIENYSLGGALDSNVGWWEDIKILDRSLDVFVIRGGATVTTLICEDLARSEPCQELVRGIGPNLVIALLMDGPQLKDRWPARYATVLAEDPGSSVLTVTSLGLINRANQAGQYPPSDRMALWRDDTGKIVELSLGRNAQALMLTLQPSKIHERTMDGRDDDTGAQSWRLTGVAPISLEKLSPRISRGLWPDKD